MSGKKFNTLDGGTWIRYSVSVWDIVKTAEENKLGHPAMFPEEICNRLIEIFTFPGETILDPFSGVGSTLIAAKHLARSAWGFEINPDYVGITNKRLSRAIWGTKLSTRGETGKNIFKFDGKSMKMEQASKIRIPAPPEGNVEVILKTVHKMHEQLAPDSIDFVLTSPPYWDILRQKRTADYKESRPYSDNGEDLGNIESYKEFIKQLGLVFQNVYTLLKPGKFCAVIVMDLRKKENFYPFHSDLANELMKRGFEFEDIIIWNRAQEYNNLRALGFPYKFRVNKIHEYVLLFSKKTKGGRKREEEESSTEEKGKNMMVEEEARLPIEEGEKPHIDIKAATTQKPAENSVKTKNEVKMEKIHETRKSGIEIRQNLNQY